MKIIRNINSSITTPRTLPVLRDEDARDLFTQALREAEGSWTYRSMSHEAQAGLMMGYYDVARDIYDPVESWVEDPETGEWTKLPSEFYSEAELEEKVVSSVEDYLGDQVASAVRDHLGHNTMAAYRQFAGEILRRWRELTAKVFAAAVAAEA